MAAATPHTLGRVVSGESAATVGYIMGDGYQYEAVVSVGVCETEADAYRRVVAVLAVMEAAAVEVAKEQECPAIAAI